MSIEKLKFDRKNFNKHTEYGMSLLEKSLRQNGAGRSILVDKDDNIIAGNGIVEAAVNAGITKTKVVEVTGDELVVVKRTDLELDSKQGREMALADNATAAVDLAWDFDAIAEVETEFDIDASDWGVLIDNEDVPTELDAEEKGGENYEGDDGSLVRDYIAPPVSVLDTRQGYWRERQKQWRDIFDSKRGRDENIMGAPANDGKYSFGYDTCAPDTSEFDPVLCEIILSWFSNKGDMVIDPFAGGCIRGVIAEMLGRKYNGFEVREEQINENICQADKLNVQPKYIHKSSEKMAEDIPKGSADLIMTCPPYFQLEQYSERDDDISTFDDEKFKRVYCDIIKQCSQVINEDRFIVFVVGNTRDKNGFCQNLGEITINAFAENGVNLYNDMVLVNHIGSGAIRARKAMNNRKVVTTHQRVLVFYKGDTTRIKNRFVKSVDKYNFNE